MRCARRSLRSSRPSSRIEGARAARDLVAAGGAHGGRSIPVARRARSSPSLRATRPTRAGTGRSRDASRGRACRRGTRGRGRRRRRRRRCSSRARARPRDAGDRLEAAAVGEIELEQQAAARARAVRATARARRRATGRQSSPRRCGRTGDPSTDRVSGSIVEMRIGTCSEHARVATSFERRFLGHRKPSCRSHRCNPSAA